jgi:hypothetical protein
VGPTGEKGGAMNGRIRFPYRHVLVALTVIAALSGSLFSVPAIASSPNLAGHWRVTYYLRCAHAAQYGPACAMAAQIKLPLPDEKNATFVTQRTLDIISDARGRFTFQSKVTTIEQVGRSKEQCHSYLETTGTLAGICAMISRGKGHIARGKTGLPDFWMEQRTTVYRGQRTYQIKRSTTLDTLTPAIPGSWDTAYLMSLHGYPPPPPGFVFRLSIMHDLSISTAAVT